MRTSTGTFVVGPAWGKVRASRCSGNVSGRGAGAGRGRDGRRLVGEHRVRRARRGPRSSRGASGRPSPPRRTFTPDRAEAAVVVLVRRRVAQDVVEAHVLGDLAEAAARVVRVAHQEAAGLLGELPEPGLGVVAQEVLVRSRRPSSWCRPSSSLPEVAVPRWSAWASMASRVAVGRAVRCAARRVHRVDRHVGAVRLGDDRLELGEHPVRDRHALGEEHDRLAARHALRGR